MAEPIEYSTLIHKAWHTINSITVNKLETVLLPCPEQSAIFITNHTNNTLLLTKKVISVLCSGDLQLKYYMPDKDIYNDEQNHGVYLLDVNKVTVCQNPYIYYLDLHRIRYVEYPYMFRVLESIVTVNRIDSLTYKNIIIVTNFDQVLRQWLYKFIEFVEWQHSSIFIFIGAGHKLINISSSSKLKSICYIQRVNFGKITQSILDTRITGIHSANFDMFAGLLFKVLGGDFLKSWIICQYYIALPANKLMQQTKSSMLDDIILPQLPVYTKIRDLLLSMKTGKPNPDLPNLLIKQTYNILALPGYTIAKFIWIIIQLLEIYNTNPGHTLYSGSKIQKILNVSTALSSADKVKPFGPDEPIIYIQDYIIKLFALLDES